MKSTMRKRWLVLALIATIVLCASPVTRDAVAAGKPSARVYKVSKGKLLPVTPFLEVPDMRPKK